MANLEAAGQKVEKVWHFATLALCEGSAPNSSWIVA